MSSYVVYDTSTGVIEATGSVGDPTVQAEGYGPGFAAIAGVADQRTEYVDLSTTTVVPRPPATFDVSKTSVAADGFDAVRMLGMNDGDEVSVYFEDKLIDSFEYSLVDEVLTFGWEGAYRIHVRSPRLLEREVTINAT